MDNVVVSPGALTIATKQDAAGTQHQSVTNEFLSSGGEPRAVATTTPMPTDPAGLADLLTAMLVEQRITNQLLYVLTNTEAEPLEMLRTFYQQMPLVP